MGFLPPAVSATAIGPIALAWRWLSGQRAADILFEEALEVAPSGMMLVEKDGSISFANSEARRMFGREDLVGLSIEALVPDKISAGHDELRRRYLLEPERRAMGKGRDLVALRRDGREFPVEIGLNPIARGGRRTTLAAIVDITARKEAEAALLRSNAELEQFAYVASHDMQEPLRMVASYTQLLAEKYQGQLDERADRYINYATEGAVRMQTLVRDLLAFSRLTSAAGVNAIVDLRELIEDALQPLNEEIANLNGSVAIGELPLVLGDRAQLRRVFQNLIGNALKFRSQAPLCISISAERVGVMAAISVEDNGIGIDPRHFDRVFLMFQRLHERGKYEGSGIGLAIVKKIVEGHGGKVWIQSALGKGAKMTLTLPAVGEDHATNTLVAGGRQQRGG